MILWPAFVHSFRNIYELIEHRYERFNGKPLPIVVQNKLELAKKSVVYEMNVQNLHIYLSAAEWLCSRNAPLKVTCG